MYHVTKYAQSCFLIEKDGQRCLIDPGNYVYERDSMQPSDWPKVDVILVTHEHPDHAHVAGIKLLVERDACPVFTNGSFARQLQDQGILARVVSPGENMTAGGFTIRGVLQKHGKLPSGLPEPEDVGFIVDDTFYTTGDSVPLPDMPHADVLFVPVAGPQMSFDTAKKMIETVKPKLTIPMHHANVQKYPIDMNELRAFRVSGTDVLVLEDTQSFEWPSE
ncbi:MAG: MBL fold metallo-hydrolase [Candidatus Kerfeldbacteria bacterium]|nr:MBL fold metallo-hydrolase [Candidatus Kerfeldbacteria bacterium]